MTKIRPAIVNVLLAVLLALTSVQMAVARGQADPAGRMVLCVGQGVVTVLVDAQGQPTGPAHICPDCALSLIAALPMGDTQLSCDIRFVAFQGVDARIIQTGKAPRVVHVRGPPVLI